MKKTIICLLTATTLQSYGAVSVILLGGQSNADGRAESSNLPLSLQSPQTDVRYFYRIPGGSASGDYGFVRPGTAGVGSPPSHGPEITIANRINSLVSADNDVVIIKYASGGTSLGNDWLANGTNSTSGDGSNYQYFQETVTLGLNAIANDFSISVNEINIAGMLWMQGESDALNSSFANDYASNLGTFITDIRANYGNDLPFVIGRLADGQLPRLGAGLATIQAAQDSVAAADSNAHIINTNSFSLKSDDLHFDSSGQQDLGEAFADQLFATGAFPVPEPSSTTLIGLGLFTFILKRKR